MSLFLSRIDLINVQFQFGKLYQVLNLLKKSRSASSMNLGQKFTVYLMLYLT